MTEAEGCKNCGQPAEEGKYKLPLCASCRDVFACRPLPLWISGVGVLLLLALVLALTLFPPALQAGIAYQRGHGLEEAGNYAAAVPEYRKVVETYPGSTQALARLAVTAYHARRGPELLFALRQLSGREVSHELADELNPIMDDLERRMKQRRGQ
jgi:hypothetical protein